MRCTDCIFYKEGAIENEDQCTHKQAISHSGGVRVHSTVRYFHCTTMLTGLCTDHKLFVPKLEVA